MEVLFSFKLDYYIVEVYKDSTYDVYFGNTLCTSLLSQFTKTKIYYAIKNQKNSLK